MSPLEAAKRRARDGTVPNAVGSVSGRELTSIYPTGAKQIALAADVPVVTFAAASAADLKPGAPGLAPARQAADGSLGTAFVVVGNQGVVPSMSMVRRAGLRNAT